MISNMIGRWDLLVPGLAPVCACRTSDNTLLISPPCNAQHASLASVLGCRALCTTVLVRVPRLQPCSNDRPDPDRPSEDPDRFRNQCAVIISAHNISCDSLSVPELQPYKITVQYFVYAILFVYCCLFNSILRRFSTLYTITTFSSTRGNPYTFRVPTNPSQPCGIPFLPHHHSFQI